MLTDVLGVVQVGGVDERGRSTISDPRGVTIQDVRLGRLFKPPYPAGDSTVIRRLAAVGHHCTLYSTLYTVGPWMHKSV